MGLVDWEKNDQRKKKGDKEEAFSKSQEGSQMLPKPGIQDPHLPPRALVPKPPCLLSSNVTLKAQM